MLHESVHIFHCTILVANLLVGLQEDALLLQIELVFLVFRIKHRQKDKLYIGFFHTGAYQESLGGYGGIQHCLIPAPQHVLVDKDKNGEFTTRLFAAEQQSEGMLKLLGYSE